MFSFVFGGLGEFFAPRPSFEEEVASLLKAGHYESALALLKQSHNSKSLNNLDKSGLAPIHVASAVGAIEFLLELISSGAEVSLPASSGSTALHFAAVNNRKGVVEVLLRSGADPSTPNGDGLIAGEMCTHPEVRALLTRDPSQLPTMFGGLSPLALTRQSLRALVEAREGISSTNGSNSSSGGGGGNNAATNEKQQRLVAMSPAGSKSAPGGGAIAIDSPSSAALHTADRFVLHSHMQSPSPDTSMLLAMATGPGPDDDDEDDDAVAAQEQEEEELRELHEAVLSAATETAQAMSTLETHDVRFQVVRLCQSCDEAKLRKLLAFDPSLATCRTHFGNLGPDGYTPLHVAAYFNNMKALRILLDVDGVSAWIRDVQGRTPLHIAAGRGHEEVCAFLRQRMASEGNGRKDPVGVNAPVDLAGSTPAGWAAVLTKGSVSPKLRSTLFEPGDKTILPRTPHSIRAGKSPKRVMSASHAAASHAASASMSAAAPADEIVFAFSVAQGWKAEMEDKVVVSFPVAGRPAWSLFGVCDGHGGGFCSTYLAANLPRIVAEAAAEVATRAGIPPAPVAGDEDTTAETLHAVLTAACLRADDELRSQPRMKVDVSEKTGDVDCKDGSGSTGVLCLITNRFVAVGNVGDSRAVLAVHAQPDARAAAAAAAMAPIASPSFPPAAGGGTYPSPGVLAAVALSQDHKFSIPAERERAEAAGAVVAIIQPEGAAAAAPAPAPAPAPVLDAAAVFSADPADLAPRAPSYEVYTNRFQKGKARLRMSRSFGDFYLKQTATLPAEQQAVVAVPEVTVHVRTGGDAFVVLACDGVFDVMSNQQVVDAVGHHLGHGAYGGGPAPPATTQRCAEACDLLLQECLTRGAHDNLSALVVVCGGGGGRPAAVPSSSSSSSSSSSARAYATHALLQSPPLAASRSASGLPETPSSGAATRTPVDRTLSRVLYSPADGHTGLGEPPGTGGGVGNGGGGGSGGINRQLEFVASPVAGGGDGGVYGHP